MFVLLIFLKLSFELRVLWRERLDLTNVEDVFHKEPTMRRILFVVAKPRATRPALGRRSSHSTECTEGHEEMEEDGQSSSSRFLRYNKQNRYSLYSGIFT